jgi:hypothetical protein
MSTTPTVEVDRNRIGIVVEDAGRCQREVWRFAPAPRHIHDMRTDLRLESYARQDRPTTRHKWRNVDRAIWRREAPWYEAKGEIQPEDVPLPEEVFARALEVAQGFITIEKTLPPAKQQPERY